MGRMVWYQDTNDAPRMLSFMPISWDNWLPMSGLPERSVQVVDLSLSSTWAVMIMKGPCGVHLDHLGS